MNYTTGDKVVNLLTSEQGIVTCVYTEGFLKGFIAVRFPGSYAPDQSFLKTPGEIAKVN